MTRTLLIFSISLITTAAMAQHVTFPSTVNEELQRLGINPADTLQVLDSLWSANSEVRYWSIQYCRDNRVRTAVPSLKQLFAQTPESGDINSRKSALRTTILRAIVSIGDSSFQDELRTEIDSLRHYERNSNELILFSSYLMEVHHDDYGYEWIRPFYSDPNKREVAKPRISALRPFLSGNHSHEVVQLLRENAMLHPVNQERAKCLELLMEVNDPNFETLTLNVSEVDTSYTVRMFARYVLKQKSPTAYVSALMSAANQEVKADERAFVYSLLVATRSPVAYKFVSDVFHENRDEENSWSIRIDLTHIGLLRPRQDESTLVIIDSLRSAVLQFRAFDWLGLNSFYDELILYLTNAQLSLASGDSIGCANNLSNFMEAVRAARDSSTADRFVAPGAYTFITIPGQEAIRRLATSASSPPYTLFATHSMHLEQNSKVFSGDIGVNDAGSPPFLDSQVELSIGIGVTTAAGSSIKAHRIKVKSGATVHGSIHYNTIENNGTITGTQHIPLQLPLVATLPEFKSATPGTQYIEVPQNGTHTLQPGSYGDIMVRRNGRLILTGGTYHLSSFTCGDNVQLICQAPAEIRIAGKFDSGQGSSIGPEDTTLVSADQIMFYVGGINGNTGNLGATPKAAKIGIANRVRASFYVPNGTLWIRQNSEATGQFIGKDVDVGIGVKVRKIAE
jgi:hypothetical protein